MTKIILLEKNIFHPTYFTKKFLKCLSDTDIIVPCSSGVVLIQHFQQSFKQKHGQFITNNTGSASMGYGISGASGAAFS